MINISKISNAYEAYTVKNASPRPVSRSEAPHIGYSPSVTGSDFTTALKAVREDMAARAVRVSQLKEQIQSGTYFVSASEVALKILGS